MFTKKDIPKIEKLAEKYKIEIISVCKKCGEHWCSIEENKIIAKCETCDTGDYLYHYADLEDTFHVLDDIESEKRSKKK